MAKSKLISVALIIRRYGVFLLYIALSCVFLTGYHFYYHTPTWSDGFRALQKNPAGIELDRDLRARSMGVYFPDADEWIGDAACVHCFSVRYDAQTKHAGYYQRGLPYITLSANVPGRSAKARASVIAHEIQHAIDDIDGRPYSERLAECRQRRVFINSGSCDLNP